METINTSNALDQFNITIDQWIISLNPYTLERVHQKPDAEA
jgi:hypothetical protein